jgi:mono/diheme cytochrome c family protein
MLCQPNPATAQSGLKPGPGREVVEAACSACHTTGYIQMNAPFLTPDVWKAEVVKMRAAFGAPIDDAVAATVLEYLNQNYGPAPRP